MTKDPNLTLADARHAKKAEHSDVKNQITVNVGWDGTNNSASFSMDGKNYATAGDMTAAIAAAHNANPVAAVLVRADRDAQYSNISDLMLACGNAGVATVTFAVLIGGDNQPKPPAGASN